MESLTFRFTTVEAAGGFIVLDRLTNKLLSQTGDIEKNFVVLRAKKLNARWLLSLAQELHEDCTEKGATKEGFYAFTGLRGNSPVV